MLFIIITINSRRGTPFPIPFPRIDVSFIFPFFDFSPCLGHSAMTKLLDKIPRLVEARDDTGCTPILSAAVRGCTDAVELLIKKVKSQRVIAHRYTLYDPPEIRFSKKSQLH